MPQKPRGPRLSDVIMDELVGDHAPWDLDKHLSGCLRGYQTDPSYGAAVYFALEALWGIAREVAVRANAGKVDPDQLDADWIISPTLVCLYPGCGYASLVPPGNDTRPRADRLALPSALKAAARANRQPSINWRRCLISVLLPAGLDRS